MQIPELAFDLNLALLLQVIGAVFGLAGQWFVSHRSAKGFSLWLVSNGALIWFQYSIGAYVLAVLHCIYFVMAVQGLLIWRKDAHKVAPT